MSMWNRFGLNQTESGYRLIFFFCMFAFMPSKQLLCILYAIVLDMNGAKSTSMLASEELSRVVCMRTK